MARLLFTVEDAFPIEGRRHIAMLRISIRTEHGIKIGDPIMLERPANS
jgi:hypothetical protein